MTDAASPGQTPSPCDSVDAVLFDFDGTLAELTIDFGEMRQRVRHLLDQYGVDGEDLQSRYVLELIDEGARALEADRRDGAAFHAQAHQAIQEVELKAADEGGLIPGASEALGWLQQQEIPFGIVTRNCRPAVTLLLNRAGIESPVLLTRDDVEHVKPDTRHLGEALRLLGRDPKRSAMVGDHPMDMETGCALGMHGIGVLTGTATPESLYEAGALEVIPSVAELPDDHVWESLRAAV